MSLNVFLKLKEKHMYKCIREKNYTSVFGGISFEEKVIKTKQTM